MIEIINTKSRTVISQGTTDHKSQILTVCKDSMVGGRSMDFSFIFFSINFRIEKCLFNLVILNIYICVKVKPHWENLWMKIKSALKIKDYS